MLLSKHAKAMGKKGGLARSTQLSSQRKIQIAQMGAKSRLESLKISKRIETNFKYLQAMLELCPPAKIRSNKNTQNKLPGLYD